MNFDDKRISRHQKYEILNNTPDEELEDMLRLDCFGGEENCLEDDTVTMILDILERRCPNKNKVNVEELWENFVEEYLPLLYDQDIKSNPEGNTKTKKL